MELWGYSLEILLFLFVIAILAGLIDTLAGGGGLVVLPALIMSGVPPLAALGTNKLQGTMGTATATYMMFRKKKVDWHLIKYAMLSAFIGSVLGTIIVQFINTDVLSFIIPVVLLMIGIYFLIPPKLAQEKQQEKMSLGQYQTRVIPFVGAYDGMFGPGTGSFFALAGVSFRSLDLISATAEAKPLNFSTNIASLFVFIIAGHVVWVVGGLMMMGQIIGAWLGAKCLFIIKPGYIRAIVVVMCFSMLIKYAHNEGWLALLVS